MRILPVEVVIEGDDRAEVLRAAALGSDWKVGKPWQDEDDGLWRVIATRQVKE